MNSDSAIINHIATTLPKSKPEIITTIIDSNIDYLTENTDLHPRVIRHIQRCLYRQFNLPHEKFFTVHEKKIATHSSIQFDHNLARFIRNLYNYNDPNWFWMITTIENNKDMIPKIYMDDFIITNFLFDVANTSVALVSISNNPSIEKNLPEPPITLDTFDILTGPTPNNPRDHYSTILVPYLVPNKPIVLTGIPILITSVING